MTKEQIQKYEYCKKHLAEIAAWKKGATYNKQMYGQGSGSPNIEHQLAGIHSTMSRDMDLVMSKASENIQKIIDEL